MLSIQKIQEFEKVYTTNIDLARYWERQLTKQQSHDEWMKVVHNRSRTLHKIFMENQSQIDFLKSEMKESMTSEVIEELYNMLLRLFYGGEYDDAMIMNHIVDNILPYYHATEDIKHIINLLNVKTWISTEYFYRQSNHPEKYSYKDVHYKIYTYYPLYGELEYEERRIIINNFYNMICVLPMLLKHNLNELLDMYDNYLEIIKKEEYDQLDQPFSDIVFRKESIIEGVWNIAEVIEYFDKEHLFHFYELVMKSYYQNKDREYCTSYYNLVSAYYYASAYIHDCENVDTGIDWYQAYDSLIIIADMLLKKLEDMEIKVIDEQFLLNYYYPYQQTTNYVFKIYRQIKGHIDSTFMKEFIHRGTLLFKKLPKGDYTWLIYAVQSEWCEYAIGALDDFKEQLALINDIVVKGQIQTYIHSQMVGLLSHAIVDKLIECKPELLLSLPYFSSVEMLKDNKKEFLHFVYQAALIHDIGKNKISSVINQQMRKLTDEEFALIKQHPEHPESGILKYTTNFKQYYDIIVGHHKSYDGKSGYPEYFDNVHSPNRILIDIITICDSIDAATDRLGRNYVGGKDIEEVIDELIKDKGTRYNPDIVDFILKCPELQNQLKNIVEKGRSEVYYQTYKEYFV